MAKKISFGGICAALSIICLLLVNVFVTNRIFFTCLATLFIPICVVRCGVSMGTVTWLASSALAFFIVPDKTAAMGFAVLGGYTLLKGFIERIRKFPVEWILKIISYVISFVGGILIFPLSDSRLMWALFGVGAVLFVLYDVVLSLGITYISKKIRLF